MKLQIRFQALIVPTKNIYFSTTNTLQKNRSFFVLQEENSRKVDWQREKGRNGGHITKYHQPNHVE